MSDAVKCNAKVSPRDVWSRQTRCTRNAVKDGWCKQHHPDAVSAREAAAAAKAAEEGAALRKRLYAPKDYIDALRRIAAGHNDPRALATEVLSKWGDLTDD